MFRSSDNYHVSLDTCNVIVPCCKIHNDASCDLSSDGTLLAAFVPSALGFPDDGMLAVYSMKKDTLGQCLYTKKFGKDVKWVFCVEKWPWETVTRIKAVCFLQRTVSKYLLIFLFPGPNAISVSISPLNSHVVVGLAARRIQWHLTSQQVKLLTWFYCHSNSTHVMFLCPGNGTSVQTYSR